jgi:hypothetical protein
MSEEQKKVLREIVAALEKIPLADRRQAVEHAMLITYGCTTLERVGDFTWDRRGTWHARMFPAEEKGS